MKSSSPASSALSSESLRNGSSFSTKPASFRGIPLGNNQSKVPSTSIRSFCSFVQFSKHSTSRHAAECSGCIGRSTVSSCEARLMSAMVELAFRRRSDTKIRPNAAEDRASFVAAVTCLRRLSRAEEGCWTLRTAALSVKEIR